MATVEDVGRSPEGGAVKSMTPPAEPAPAHARLRRHPEEGIIGGICAGLARFTGIDVLFVRLLAALLVLYGGVGAAIYLLAGVLMPVAPESVGVPRPHGAWRRVALTVAFLAAGLAGLHLTSLHFRDAGVWPLAIGVGGLALAWRLTVGATRGGSPQPALPWRRGGQYVATRVAVATLLVAFATSALLHTFGILHTTGKEAAALAIIATTLGLLVGPWFVRLVRTLGSERAARIREQERAELAAHLHDSVLQTLALIQTRAGDAREVAALARKQERELRRWLLEPAGASSGDSVKALFERAAAEVEELHRVPVETVIVGDAAPDPQLEALVLAAREAMTNAAKFSAAERVDLYAEIEPGRVEAFVRDRGVGFDSSRIPADRRGVRDSIVARMQRHGGVATVRSAPGQGTEVELVAERVHRDRGEVGMSPPAGHDPGTGLPATLAGEVAMSPPAGHDPGTGLPPAGHDPGTGLPATLAGEVAMSPPAG